MFAQPVIPNTPAGHALSDWLTSFNSADATQIASFKQKYSRKGEVAETLEFRESPVGFELLQLEHGTADNLLALLREIESGRGVYLVAIHQQPTTMLL